MANTKVTGDLIASSTIATGNIADNAVTSDKISGITTAHITEGSNLYYTDARADARVALVVDSAPSTLNTLNELADALGDDPNFATTTATSIGLKAPLASPSFTGNATFAGNVNVTGEAKVYTGSNFSYWGVDAGNSYVYLGTNASAYGLSLQTGGIDRININDAGNVFISTPITNAFYGLSLTYNNNNTADFTVNQATGQIKIGGVATGYYPTFYAAGSEKMRIDTSGNLTLNSATALDFQVADFAQIKFRESGAITIDSDNNQSSRNFAVKDGDGTNLLTVFDTGNSTFAGEITSGDDINTPTKIVIGESASPELRLKKTNAGYAKISYYSDNSQKAYVSLDAAEDMVYYGAASVSQLFYAGGALNLTLSGTEATFAGNVTFNGPSTKFNTDGDSFLEILDAGTNACYIRAGAGDELYLGANNGYQLRLKTNKDVVMDNGGKLGIGTSSPNKALTVYGSNDNGIWIDSQGDQYTSLAFGHNGTEKANIAWDNTNGYTNISTYANGHLALSTGGRIGAFLNSTGNFGVGDTAPTSISANTYSLSVNSTRNDLSGALINKANGNIKHQQYWDSSGYSFNITANSGPFKFNGADVQVNANIKANDVDGKIFSMVASWAYVASKNDLFSFGGTEGALWEYTIKINPNTAGSGAYRDFYYGKLGIGIGWNGSNLTQYIWQQQDQIAPRSLYSSGGGNFNPLFRMYYSGGIYTQLAYGTAWTLQIQGLSTTTYGDIFFRRLA